MAVPVPEKIILKNTTGISLNERFSNISKSVEEIRVQTASRKMEVSRQNRFHQQMRNRPVTMYSDAVDEPFQADSADGRPSALLRLGDVGRGRGSSRGRRFWRGWRGGRGRGRGGYGDAGPDSTFMGSRGRPFIRGRGFRWRSRGRARGRGRGGQVADLMSRELEDGYDQRQNGTSERGRSFSRGRSRGYRGGGRRGRGQGEWRGGRGRTWRRGGGRQQPPPSREQLDEQLDNYMHGTLDVTMESVS